METSFYIMMGILGVLSALNLFITKNQKKSKARTVGMWANGFALVMIVIAVAIAQITK